MKFKIKLLILFFSIIVTFNIFLYSFDRIVTPIVLTVADAEIRAKTMEIINSSILDECSKNFKYDEVIKVDKDNTGNIVLLKADTLILNKIAADISINSQKKLKEIGDMGIKMPFGYIFQNNILAGLGPDIKIKMRPIGNIETKYSSEFETAGINQTRHKIYVVVTTQIRVVIPMRSNVLEVKNEIPICETIIVGKTPNNAINLDLQRSGYKINN
jgi:sporulation protein YunB